VWAAEDKEIVEDQETAEDQRWIVMYDGGSPGKKRLRHRFCPTGFPVHCALVRISRFTREGTEERESHDVLHGVAGLWRSLRAPGGTRLERGIM
jgi:hypothetical protein